MLSPLVHNSVLAVALLASALSAQNAGFSAQNLLSTNAQRARDVATSDLNGDGDLDALSASSQDNKLAWYENQGGGVFGAEQIISTSAEQVDCLEIADLNGDGREDILWTGKGIGWIPVLGNGTFGPEVMIEPIGSNSHWDAQAVDLDNDQDLDVLSVSLTSGFVFWYENLGSGSFGPQQVISPQLVSPVTVHAADFDADGDEDVFSASKGLADELVWFENLGGGSFGPKQVLTTEGGSVDDLLSADIDTDGDPDLVSVSRNGNEIAWFENLPGDLFGPRRIAAVMSAPTSVCADDLDGDGDVDLIYGNLIDFDNVGWFENQGDGLFSTYLAIEPENSQNIFAVWSVHVADLDGDGRSDVMTATTQDNKISWWANETENLLISICNGDGGAPSGCTNCPCGNDAPLGTGGGCLNSVGASCRLLLSGRITPTAPDIEFRAAGAPPLSNALLVSGNQMLPGNPANPCFGTNSGILSPVFDGIRCVGQGLIRHGVRTSDANGIIGVTTPGWGSDDTQTACALNCLLGSLSESVIGVTRYFQLIYRDDVQEVCQTGLNTSQAVALTVGL